MLGWASCLFGEPAMYPEVTKAFHLYQGRASQQPALVLRLICRLPISKILHWGWRRVGLAANGTLGPHLLGRFASLRPSRVARRAPPSVSSDITKPDHAAALIPGAGDHPEGPVCLDPNVDTDGSSGSNRATSGVGCPPSVRTPPLSPLHGLRLANIA